MAETVVDLTFEREKAEDDNAKVRPESLLRMAQEYVEKTPRVTRIIVLVENENEDGSCTMERFRCGCTRAEELGLLDLAKHIQIQQWIDDK